MRQKQFGAIPNTFSSADSAKAFIIPVPFEGGHPLFKGSEKGPDAVIEASTYIDLYDIHTDSDTWKVGVHTTEPIKERNAEKMIKEMGKKITPLLKKKKFPIILGGESTIAIGAYKACADYFKENDLTIVQFDAHAALRKDFFGNTTNHFTTAGYASQLAPILQMGVRSMNIDEREVLQPGRVFSAENILDASNKSWMYDFLNKLTKNVFISIDLDVFDPALIPAVATPVPGGLIWKDVIDIIEKINEKSIIAGICIAGLTPIKYNKAPNVIVAQLINSLITMKFSMGLH